MNENITKEGVEVKPGQVWRDLDKRMPGRYCKVMEVANGKASMVQCHANGTSFRVVCGKTTISIRRMHKHSTGWELVRQTN